MCGVINFAARDPHLTAFALQNTNIEADEIFKT
jgi:hypothetical protein